MENKVITTAGVAFSHFLGLDVAVKDIIKVMANQGNTHNIAKKLEGHGFTIHKMHWRSDADAYLEYGVTGGKRRALIAHAEDYVVITPDNQIAVVPEDMFDSAHYLIEIDEEFDHPPTMQAVIDKSLEKRGLAIEALSNSLQEGGSHGGEFDL